MKMIILLCFFVLKINIADVQGVDDREIQRIESLLGESENYLFKDELKSLKCAQMANVQALRVGDMKLIAKTYLQVSECLNELEMYDESFSYIKKGLKVSREMSSKLFEAQFKLVKGSNFKRLGLFDQELKEYNEALNLISNLKGEEAIWLSFRLNASKASYFQAVGEYKYANYWIDKAIKEKDSLIGKSIIPIPEVSSAVILKGYICMGLNEMDSAYIYYDRSMHMMDSLGGGFSKFLEFTAFGDYYNKLENSEQALKYYFLSLQDLEQYGLLEKGYEIATYSYISEIYESLDDEVNSKKYKDLYYIKGDDLHQQNLANIKSAVDLLLEEKSNEEKETNKRMLLVGLSILILMLIVFSYLYYVYKRKKAIRLRIINEKERLLLNQRDVIKEKEEETIRLEQKLKITLDAVIEEAKRGGGVSFFEKFLIYYPEFTSNLLKASDDLNAGDLTLLAYVYLNFNSKEIGDYTFRSYRTIQTRKYNLRKKLKLNSNEDLYVWLKENV